MRIAIFYLQLVVMVATVVTAFGTWKVHYELSYLQNRIDVLEMERAQDMQLYTPTQPQQQKPKIEE